MYNIYYIIYNNAHILSALLMVINIGFFMAQNVTGDTEDAVSIFY